MWSAISMCLNISMHGALNGRYLLLIYVGQELNLLVYISDGLHLQLMRF